MGKFSRDKGRRWERDSVHIAQAYGLDATADGWKQCKDGDDTYSDVQIMGRRYFGDLDEGSTLFGYDHVTLRAECKHREDIPLKLWKWLEGHDVLLLKRNNKTPLAVMPYTEYLALIGGNPEADRCLT